MDEHANANPYPNMMTAGLLVGVLAEAHREKGDTKRATDCERAARTVGTLWQILTGRKPTEAEMERCEVSEVPTLREEMTRLSGVIGDGVNDVEAMILMARRRRERDRLRHAAAVIRGEMVAAGVWG